MPLAQCTVECFKHFVAECDCDKIMYPGRLSLSTPPIMWCVDRPITEQAGWSMLTTCDKCDDQTFTGGALRPIGFGRTLCMSESWESMHGPGIVDVIAVQVGREWHGPGIVDVIAVQVGGEWVEWVQKSITGCCSRFTGHTSPLTTCCC